ncbi:MAG: DUF1365 domain-containing protein [Gammaproteobacteria bacterium]|nr:DUF1365 domain-containing protein [Gammaproteobacteria bacterium]
MHSKIYVGQVNHKRYLPHEHGFSYRMFMMYLDLDELPNLFDRFIFWSAKRFNLAYFNRKLHMGDEKESLKQSVLDLVFKQENIKLNGPVRLLTHLSYFGFGFNPASFYYCFDETGETVEVIVVEVNNTPWGEQFCYVLPATKSSHTSKHVHELSKEFHVSPFNSMDQDYEWRLSDPGEHLSVYMKNNADGEKIFDAVLALRSLDINSLSLAKMLTGFPFMTLKVITAIYFEALKLWLKRTPIFDHPFDNPADEAGKNYINTTKNKEV